MASQRISVTLNVLAALFLTISITMLTDFTRRLLSSDPDSVGILSISVQAVLAVVATSSFTTAGWAWLGGLLQRFGTGVHNKAQWRFALALGLVCVLAPLWHYLPPILAEHYNAQGFNLRASDPGEALQNYERAVALNPQLHLAYVNLGGLLEGFYRYDDAASQYRKAITVDHADPIPYNNLSRLLLLGGDSITALRIAEDALRLKPGSQVTSALLKNKAWAELNLGFYNQAVEDARKSNSAAGECILAKTYNKLGKPADVALAWSSFRNRTSTLINGEPVIEPDCELLAEAINEKN